MESTVRQIVSRLGADVATRKLVSQEYCKIRNIVKLSAPEKKELRQIWNSLAQDIADQDISIEIPGDSLPSTSESAHDITPVTNENNENDEDHLPSDDQGEIDISESEVDKIIHDKYLSDIQELLGDQKKNDSVIKEEVPPPTSTKKKRFRKIRSKDVMDSIMDSDNEFGFVSPHKSPGRCETAVNKIVYDDSPIRQKRPSKKRSDEVIDSILYSDSCNDASLSSEGGVSSPTTTPMKVANNCKTIVEDSPLFKHNSKSKRKVCFSDSESDVDENVVVENRTKSLNSNSPLAKRQKTNSCDSINGGSDSDSVDDCNIGDTKLTGVKSKSSVCQRDVREKGDSEIGDEKKEHVDDYDAVIKKCEVVIEDCLLNPPNKMSKKKLISQSHSRGNFKRKRSLSRSDDNSDHNSQSNSRGNIKRKRLLSCSDDNSDHDLSLEEASSPHTVDRKKSEKTSVLTDKSNKEKRKENHEASKPQSKKNENKELKSLRAICRHVGVILRNTIELEGCDTDVEKIKRIKALLREKGMKGRPSMKSAEQFNLERELRELGGDVNCDGESKTNVKGSRRQARRRGDFIPKNSPPVSACDDFSHMKDIFCADDLSD